MLFREALAIRRRTAAGSASPLLALSLYNIGRLREAKGDRRGALGLFLEAIGQAEATLGSDHWMTASYRARYGSVLASLGHFEEGEAQLLPAHALLADQTGIASSRTQVATRLLVELYEAWGKANRAAEYQRLLAPQAEE